MIPDTYTKLSKALALSFMEYLDKIRPEGKMCLSNMECSDIESAFTTQDWGKLLKYFERYYKQV